MRPLYRSFILRPIGILLFIGLQVGSMAQSSSDDCGLAAANEYPVHDNMCLFTTFNVSLSHTASMNPSSCSSGMNDDSWGWFVATQPWTVITFDPESSHRSILHVFTGSCGSLTEVGCKNAGGNGINAQVVINTVIGQTYYFRVQRHNSNSGMNGRICIYNPPANDNCSVAIELMAEEECYPETFTNEGATASTDTPTPTCGGTLNSSTMLDIWFEFYAPESGIVEIHTSAGTLTDAVMQLYRGTCNGLTLIDCDDNDGPGNMPYIDRSCDPLVPFDLYTLRVFGRNGAQGTFDICVQAKSSFTNPHEDCYGAVTLCDDSSISNNSTDFGCTQDLASTNRGCLASNERQGTWYFFSPSAAGQFELTIRPVDGSGNTAAVDYDFAVWGPNVALSCPPSATPMRCSYASPTNSGLQVGAGTYLTGMAAGNTDTSEPAYNSSGGTTVNGFVAPLVVAAADVGKKFIMFVDNFDQNGQSFKIDWTLSGGASLGCVVLPVEMSELQAVATTDHVALQWVTLTESATERFIVERSMNGRDFDPIGMVEAAGNSQERIEYEWHDTDPVIGVGYYRLQQIDTDGATNYSDVVSAAFKGHNSTLIVHPNPASERITLQIDDAGIHQIEVIDGSGRIVHSMQQATDGAAAIQLDLARIDKGSYLIRSRSSGGTISIGRFVRN